ncbi:hypothetical protein Belba_2130 [Belliella baltica DSM 15883]|uniref:Uncharacterized protein n=1 Tax=Belliella baltica (strain DSM 15883 / CIP 108006 / LMG 21964 / BA134) TaxID=866536 RepID=I3Z630_BELBD|nr:hypothetical protein [Belliella baltica]AFL84698.1 hypothetical protein Belba_2130 [Belliella baltica DSM 15883]
MKNTKKLILANVFALLAVVVFLTLGNTFGIDFGSATTSLLVKALFLLIPQVGFIYLYWMSLRSAEERNIA